MSNYIPFDEDQKKTWKKYVLTLLVVMKRTKKLPMLWIVLQQIYELAVYCAPRTDTKPFNVKDIKRINLDDKKWVDMCDLLGKCRNIATHNAFEYKNISKLHELFDCREELSKLIEITFEDEAFMFDDLLDAYSLYMN